MKKLLALFVSLMLAILMPMTVMAQNTGAYALRLANSTNAISSVSITVEEPKPGEYLSFSVSTNKRGCSVSSIEWYDLTGNVYHQSEGGYCLDGHQYRLILRLSAQSGYSFSTKSGEPNVSAQVNNQMAKVTKVSGESAADEIEVQYTFGGGKHTCKLNYVSRQEPTCTSGGRRDYYYCDCGKGYADASGTYEIDPETWGFLEPLGHDWYEEWTHTSAYGHATLCNRCGKASELFPHEPGPEATYGSAQTCIQCGYVIAEAVQKNYVSNVEINNIDAPQMGDSPDYDVSVGGPGFMLRKINDTYTNYGVSWYDITEGRYIKQTEKFKGNHEYQLYIQVVPETGSFFDMTSLVAKVDGKAAEAFGNESEVTLCYIYPPCKDVSHYCKPTLVAKKAPTCTQDGKEAYYLCTCGACYTKADGTGKISNIDTWGVLKATGHKESAWKTDKNYHWKECTVCDSVLMNLKRMHKDENKDGKCDSCSYSLGIAVSASSTISVSSSSQAISAQSSKSSSQAASKPSVSSQTSITSAASSQQTVTSSSAAAESVSSSSVSSASSKIETAPEQEQEEKQGEERSSWVVPILLCVICFMAGIIIALLLMRKK